ncbi:MAG: TetR/AcrR family transcriptional regulator [Zavarzinella sp.]
MSENLPLKRFATSVTQPASLPRKSEKTRTAILEAALEFVWDHPFRDMTVASITSRTGISRSAFYQYFNDLHDLMEVLLRGLGHDILEVSAPWFHGEGDPLPLLKVSLGALVQVCYERGPIVRAVSDAAPSDERLEKSWSNFLSGFDDIVAARIKQHQDAGLIPMFDPHPVAVALNRMDAALVIQSFGRRPQAEPRPVLETMIRIWSSTLYPNRTGSDPIQEQ